MLHQFFWYIYRMTDLDNLTSEVLLNLSIIWFYNSSYAYIRMVCMTGILLKQSPKFKEVCRYSSKESEIKKIILTGSWKGLKIVEGIQEKKCMINIHKRLIRDHTKARWQRNWLEMKKSCKDLAQYHDGCHRSSLLVLQVTPVILWHFSFLIATD